VLRDVGAPLGWAGYQVGGEAQPVQTLQKMDEFSTGLPARIAGLPDGAPGNATLIGLARSALRVRDAIRAADLAEAVLARGDAANGHQILGDACAIQREQLKAVQEWHQALAADPANVNALLSLADFNMDRTNYADAERYLSQALHIRPDDPDLLFARGRVLYLLKRYPESEKDLARSLAREGDEEMPLALYYLGLIQQQKGNLEGAAELLRRYLQWGYRQGKLTAVEADVHLALADVYRGLKLPDLADQQRKAGETLKSRLAESAREQRRAYLDFLLKP
jgi:tetratricopeptide (TPR) repeat protein